MSNEHHPPLTDELATVIAAAITGDVKTCEEVSARLVNRKLDEAHSVQVRITKAIGKAREHSPGDVRGIHVVKACNVLDRMAALPAHTLALSLFALLLDLPAVTEDQPDAKEEDTGNGN